LAEVLVFSGDALDEWLNTINTTSVFEVADFDQRAAIDLTLMEQAIRKQGDKREHRYCPFYSTQLGVKSTSLAKFRGFSRCP